VATGATLGEITRALRISDNPSAPITPVRITRAAARVEALRDATNRHVARTGQAPRAFLCNMGPLRQHKARADFARGFLAVGGFDAVYPRGFSSPEDAAEAFAGDGAAVVVICSTDDDYPALVPPLVKAIRAARPDAVILLAGYPEDQVEAHRQSGVDDFIHVRADVCEVFKRLQARLGFE
jgi:methylmalonyl-CoA mutase